jgi:Ca2+-binding EF-hand superfamily protein
MEREQARGEAKLGDVELGATNLSSEPRTFSMSASEVIESFITLDEDKDGLISNVEFIEGLKSNWHIAQKFGLDQNTVMDNVQQKKYNLVFGQIDTDHSKSIDVSMLDYYNQSMGLAGSDVLCSLLAVCRFWNFWNSLAMEKFPNWSLLLFSLKLVTRANISKK